MKPSRAPKLIHKFLIEKGFGYEKKFRIYIVQIHESPINSCIFFTKHKEMYEINFGICYPNKANSSGAFINPRQASTLLPNGKLLMTSDYDSDNDMFWDFSNQGYIVEQLNKCIPYWLKVILDPLKMIGLIDYCMNLTDDVPIEFANIRNIPHLFRKEIPINFWHKSLYAMLKEDFTLAQKCIQHLPDWSQEGEDTQKVLSDCKEKKITVSDDLIKYMQEIGAKEIDLDNW